MADIAASVLARLKNKAAESGRSYQLCLQLFCQEEFLRCLEKSKYAENLVLKILAHPLTLILVLAMSLCQSRKKEKFPFNLMILLHRQLTLIPPKRLLLKKLTQSSV